MAVIRRPLSLSRSSYRGSAALAGFIIAFINQQLLAEITGFAITAAVVTQSRAALPDSITQYRTNFSCQHFHARQGDTASSPCRMNTSPEQGFVGIDVTYPGNDLAVHDVLLDRDFASCACFMQISASEIVAQRFGAQFDEQRMFRWRMFLPKAVSRSAVGH